MAKNIEWAIEDGRANLTIEDAVTVEPGGFVGMSLSTGKMENCANDADILPCGIVVGNERGLNQFLTGDAAGTHKAIARGGIVLRKADVAGVTGVANVGDKVYATDDETLTLTAGVALVFGRIIGYKSNDDVEVYVYSLSESLGINNP